MRLNIILSLIAVATVMVASATFYSQDQNVAMRVDPAPSELLMQNDACEYSMDMEKALAAKGGKVKFASMQTFGAEISLWANEPSGNWVLVKTYSGGLSCKVSTGNGFLLNHELKPPGLAGS